MKTKIENQIESGAERIDQIKQKISLTSSPRVCKAEVYEMWDGVFDPEEE